MEPGGKEGNTPQAAALEVPMDTNDGADLVRDGTYDDRTPLSRVLPSGSPLPVSALPQIDEMEVNAQVEGTVRGQPLEESDQKPVTDCCLHASQADMCMMDEGEGVTSEAAEPAFSACGHIGVPGLTERVTKMLTGVEGGPVASGGGRAADQLNIQDLRDIRDAVTDGSPCLLTGLANFNPVAFELYFELDYENDTEDHLLLELFRCVAEFLHGSAFLHALFARTVAAVPLYSVPDDTVRALF